MGSNCCRSKKESSANSMNDIKIDNLLTIATWNIHEWQDEEDNTNFHRIVQYIINEQRDIDILGLVEVKCTAKSKNILSKSIENCLTEFRDKTSFKFRSQTIAEDHEEYTGLVVVSKYAVIQTIESSDRNYWHGIPIQFNVVKYDAIEIGIVLVHYWYKEEWVRCDEYAETLQLIKDKHDLPLIFMGDFNALSKSDYTDIEWNEICAERKENQWEVPETRLMNEIMNEQGFIDCMDEYKKIDDTSWNRNKLSTCRYNTRIDYIFVNHKFLSLFEIIDFQHLNGNNLSDHKMVKATFKLKEKTS